MLLRTGEYSRNRRTGSRLDGLEQLRGAQRLAGYDQRAPRSAPLQLVAELFDFARAENHALETREVVFTRSRFHRESPRLLLRDDKMLACVSRRAAVFSGASCRSLRLDYHKRADREQRIERQECRAPTIATGCATVSPSADPGRGERAMECLRCRSAPSSAAPPQAV